MRVCTIIDTGDTQTSYGYCPRIHNQQDITRPKIDEIVKGRFICVSPDDYGTIMKWAAEHPVELPE